MITLTPAKSNGSDSNLTNDNRERNERWSSTKITNEPRVLFSNLVNTTHHQKKEQCADNIHRTLLSSSSYPMNSTNQQQEQYNANEISLQLLNSNDSDSIDRAHNNLSNKRGTPCNSSSNDTFDAWYMDSSSKVHRKEFLSKSSIFTIYKTNATHDQEQRNDSMSSTSSFDSFESDGDSSYSNASCDLLLKDSSSTCSSLSFLSIDSEDKNDVGNQKIGEMDSKAMYKIPKLQPPRATPNIVTHHFDPFAGAVNILNTAATARNTTSDRINNDQHRAQNRKILSPESFEVLSSNNALISHGDSSNTHSITNQAGIYTDRNAANNANNSVRFVGDGGGLMMNNSFFSGSGSEQQHTQSELQQHFPITNQISMNSFTNDQSAAAAKLVGSSSRHLDQIGARDLCNVYRSTGTAKPWNDPLNNALFTTNNPLHHHYDHTVANKAAETLNVLEPAIEIDSGNAGNGTSGTFFSMKNQPTGDPDVQIGGIFWKVASFLCGSRWKRMAAAFLFMFLTAFSVVFRFYPEKLPFDMSDGSSNNSSIGILGTNSSSTTSAGLVANHSISGSPSMHYFSNQTRYTRQPTTVPWNQDVVNPAIAPTSKPSILSPTKPPLLPPTHNPTAHPSQAPSTNYPTSSAPTKYPTSSAPTTESPTVSPSTNNPTDTPTWNPSTDSPTENQFKTFPPTATPTAPPTNNLMATCPWYFWESGSKCSDPGTNDYLGTGGNCLRDVSLTYDGEQSLLTCFEESKAMCKFLGVSNEGNCKKRCIRFHKKCCCPPSEEYADDLYDDDRNELGNERNHDGSSHIYFMN